MLRATSRPTRGSRASTGGVRPRKADLARERRLGRAWATTPRLAASTARAVALALECARVRDPLRADRRQRRARAARRRLPRSMRMMSAARRTTTTARRSAFRRADADMVTAVHHQLRRRGDRPRGRRRRRHPRRDLVHRRDGRPAALRASRWARRSSSDAVTARLARLLHDQLRASHPFRRVLEDGGDWLARMRGLRANASRAATRSSTRRPSSTRATPPRWRAEFAALREALPRVDVARRLLRDRRRHVAAVGAAWGS